MDIDLRISCVVEKCISVYEEYKKLSETVSGNRLGKFPEYVVIRQIKTIPGKTKLSNKREVISIWKYENSILQLLENDINIELVRDGMYYDVAQFWFEIEGDNVKMSYTFGPRFGRGIHYDLLKDDLGWTVYNEKNLWTS